jgi:hypothetical protein
MSERIAAQLATVIATFEPLGKQKRETQKTLLAAMLKGKKTEVRSGDRVFVVKSVKKRPKAINYANLVTWYEAFGDNHGDGFDIQEFITFIKGERDKSVSGIFNHVLRSTVVTE